VGGKSKGGAIYISGGGSIDIDECIFLNNSAISEEGSEGAVMSVEAGGEVRITNSMFERNNVAGEGKISLTWFIFYLTWKRSDSNHIRHGYHH